MLDFRILGPVEVIDGGELLPLGGRKQRAVLAALLIEAGRVVSTDRLVEALWGEEPPRTAATSLQNFVSQLRKVVGADVLLTRPPGYELRLAANQLDLDRFRSLVEGSRTLAVEERARALRSALELWRGPPLADFEYDAFARPEIVRLEELRLSVLEDRIDADLEAGRHAEVVGELQSLVSANPSRERLCGQFMLALYRSGRKAEASQAFHDLRRELDEELGLEPGPDLRRLHGSILRDDPALEPGGAEPEPDEHFAAVAAALRAGRVVPEIGRAHV